jgi:hypothetical protein
MELLEGGVDQELRNGIYGTETEIKELEILVLGWCLEVLEASFEMATRIIVTKMPGSADEAVGYAALNGKENFLLVRSKISDFLINLMLQCLDKKISIS